MEEKQLQANIKIRGINQRILNFKGLTYLIGVDSFRLLAIIYHKEKNY